MHAEARIDDTVVMLTDGAQGFRRSHRTCTSTSPTSTARTVAR
jgi:hypothetical protein